jgi:hypothetical protein
MDPKPDASAPAPEASAPSPAPAEHAAYPRLSPEEMAPPPPPVVPPAGANPYVLSAPSPNPPAKSELPPARCFTLFAALVVLVAIGFGLVCVGWWF